MSKKDTIKFDPLSRALMEKQAVDLGQPRAANPIAAVFAEDLVVEGDLDAEGKGTFFTKRGGEWGAFQFDRDIYAVSTFAVGGTGSRVLPIVCARVLVRLRMGEKDKVVADLCTKGDGSTPPLPGRVFPIPTPLGQVLHCPIRKGDDFRVEVHHPGYAGETIRVALHAMKADPVEGA